MVVVVVNDKIKAVEIWNEQSSPTSKHHSIGTGMING
jgi:hypothetical protein